MRNLFKKSLTLCLVAILAFSCFAGIVSAENPFTATIAVENQTITKGTTSVDVTLNITSSEVGINEALIEVSSPLGTIATEATLVSYTTANNEKASIEYPKGSTNFGSFYLSVADDLTTDPSTMGSLSAAEIKVTFTVAADAELKDYDINIAVDGVRAASGNEDVISFTYATAKVTVAAPHVHNVVWTSDKAGNHTSSCDAEGCKDFEAVTEPCADNDADNACDKCGYVLVTEPEEPERTHVYTSSNYVQIRMIEPWALKINTLIKENNATIDYSTLQDYGIYFYQAPTLDDNGKGNGNFTDVDNETEEFMKFVVSNGSAYLKSNGKAEIDAGGRITAAYDEGLYTYEMNRSFYCVTYLRDENGAEYYTMRERNLLNLLETRKDDTKNFPNANERNSYQSMFDLFNYVDAFREGKDTSIEEAGKPVKIAEYDFTGYQYNANGFTNYVQIRLIEPWGLRVSAIEKNFTQDNYEDYGYIIYYDIDKVYDSAAVTYTDILADENTLVYSKSGGSATIDNGRVTAIYSEGIYTYQLNSNAYVIPFVKKDGVITLGGMRTRNLYTLTQDRSTDVSGFPDPNERGAYDSMYKLYEHVKAFRADSGIFE